MTVQILDALVDLRTLMYQYVGIWNTVYVFAHAEKVTSLPIYIFWFFFLAVFICLNHDRNVILGAFLMAAC